MEKEVEALKKLITVNDIKNLSASGNKVCFAEPGTIITPAAKDAASEFGVVIRYGSKETDRCCGDETEAKTGSDSNITEEISKRVCSSLKGIDQEMVYSIVREVLSGLPEFQVRDSLVKEVDSSGSKLVRGSSIAFDRFETGNSADKVGIKDIFNIRESPNMGAGFMTIEKTTFPWTLNYDELDYVIEGVLEITINGRKYTGKQGDVFYIPKGTGITFGSPGFCKFYYTTYPANWAEQSG